MSLFVLVAILILVQLSPISEPLTVKVSCMLGYNISVESNNFFQGFDQTINLVLEETYERVFSASQMEPV